MVMDTDGHVAALLPAIIPNDTPKETLRFPQRSFGGFFKDPVMKFAAGMPTPTQKNVTCTGGMSKCSESPTIGAGLSATLMIQMEHAPGLE